MPYARKRAKPNPKASPVVQEPRSLSTSISPTAVVESTQNENSEATAQAEASDRSEDSRKLSGNPSKRWYGSWNNKVVPVTQVTSSSATVTSTTSKNRADELAETTSVSSTPSSEAPKVALRSPYSHLSPGGSTRSLPVTATTTKLHVSSSDLNISNSNRSNGSLKVGDTQVEQPAKSTSETENHIQEENHTSSIAPTPETNSNVNWLGWLPYGGTKKESPTNKSQECEIEDSTNNLSKEGQPTSPKKQRRESDPTPVTKVERTSKLEPPQAPISWLSRWTTMNSASTPAPTSEDPSSRIIKSSNVPAENNLPLETTVTPTNPAESATPSSGWAFWSRSPAIAASGSMNTGYGQLAVANSSAQDNSAGAIIESRGLSGTPNSLGKRIRPRSQEIPRGNKKEDDNVTVESSENETRIAKSSSLGEPVITVASNKKGNTAHNLLLPSFRRTFSPGPESLNFFQQLSRFLYAQPSIFKRLTLIKDPPRIRKALAIGVHGYFPLPIIQTVLGRPTGTSIKFAENAARAIHQFAQTRGYSIDKVEKIALEGEGKIEERIDILCMFTFRALKIP